ncbi:MAG: hypothetical protein QW734_06565 [Candidatus Bathyarchaeia archaeon]
MKDWRIIDLKDFLEIANNIESPFKFYEIVEDRIKASIWLRTAIISWEGEKGEERIEILKSNGFKEAKELETRKLFLEELL